MAVSGCGEKKTVKKITPVKTANTTNASTSVQDEIPVNTGPKTKIDLQAGNTYWAPSNIEVGSSSTLKIIVKNGGVESSGEYDIIVTISKNGAVWKKDTITVAEGLGAGNGTKITKDYKFDDTGTYSTEIYIDKGNKINELIETNNYAKAMADLVVLQPIQEVPKETPPPDEEETP